MMNIFKITKELCAERCSDALKEYIGPRKTWTYAAAAEALGMEEATIISHVAGRATPEMAKLLRYCALLGPRFSNRILRLAGQDGARAQTVGAVTDHQLAAEVGDCIASLTNALRDGRMDHRERAHVLRELREVMDVAEAYNAQHEHGPCAPDEAAGDETLVGRVLPRETSGRLDS